MPPTTKDARHLVVSPISQKVDDSPQAGWLSWWCSIMLAGRLSLELAKVLVAS
jgi:hypothetical protein